VRHSLTDIVSLLYEAGNKKFRDAVSAALDDYMKVANRLEKSLVVHSIVDAIHGAGGRFLKKDFRSGKWYELSDKQGKEKVGHAIRDAVSSHENKKGKARKQKVGLKAPPVARPKDSTDSGSSGTEQTRSVYENLASLPQSAVISAAAAVATAPTVGKYDSPKSNDNSHERQFLAEIDEMLGPLPPNAEDPMEPFLRRGRL
jgi:hypothetical protein